MSLDPKVWATSILKFLFGWIPKQKVCHRCGGSGEIIHNEDRPRICQMCNGKGWVR
jgi:DnaJ-class molecular chaperone